MKRLNELLQELGVSKVKLAKYLGVSRQMVYNYLVLDDLDKWPKEKKLLLLQLLDIKDENELENINVTTEYLVSVEKRLNTTVRVNNENDDYLKTIISEFPKERLKSKQRLFLWLLDKDCALILMVLGQIGLLN